MPGWNIEEKNICSKYVCVDELSAAYMVKKDKRSGKEDIKKINVNDLVNMVGKMIGV